MEKYENSSLETNFTGKDVCCERSIMPPVLDPDMLILTADDVLKTYPEYEAESARKYFEYLKLKEENPTFGYKRLAKMLGVSISRTRCWKQWDGKPTSVTAIEKLTAVGLLPLHADNAKLPGILRLLAAGFTDGGIDKRLNTFHFNSARMENILAWKKDFIDIFPFGEKTLSAIITGEKETSIGVRTTDRAIVRFFAALGCPVGNKTNVSYKLPEFLFSILEEHKAAFLDGFFSCEAGMPPSSFSISLSKIEEKEMEHLTFLNKFCKLCESVGIKYTSINLVPQKEMLNGKPRRKDGKTCDSYRILFSFKPENVIRAHKLIPLTYAAEKKERFDRAVKKYHQRYLPAPIKSLNSSIDIDANNSLQESATEESSQAESLVL